jgi:hypothetical protein
MEVLTAFVRERSHKQRPPVDNQSGADVPLRATRPEVQAAVAVVGRRDPKNDRQTVNLNAADLTGADLTGADLTGAKLNGADLTRADLTGADLTGAKLAGANLTGADLTSARLADAWLPGVDFTGATLNGASLTRANLARATLTDADLTFADLGGVDFTSVNRTGVNLSFVYLTGAVWPMPTEPPAGWQQDYGGRLARIPSARPTEGQLLPDWVREKLFLPDERIATVVPKHPAVLMASILWVLFGLIIGGAVTGASRNPDLLPGIDPDLLSSIAGFVWIFWVLWALLAVWLGWKVAAWLHMYVVVTERRMMLVEGGFKRSAETLLLTKVTDLRVHPTLFGRLFGYGDLIVESAGQEQAPSRVPFIPYPQQVLNDIVAVIFPRPLDEGDPDP